MVNNEIVMNEIVNSCITEIAKYVVEKLKGLTKVAVEKSVFASVVDAIHIPCDSVKYYYSGHIDSSKKIGSILLLAVRLNSKMKIYVKGYTTFFTPSNMNQHIYIGEYLSNSITCIKENEVVETHVFVDPKDDFFTESTIDDSNRIFILPLIFADLSTSNIENFSDVQFVIVDQDDKIHKIQVDLTSSICNRKYIEQRVSLSTDI